MIAFVIRRVLVGIAMVVVMIFVVFSLFFANGNPAINQCGKTCTPEKLEQLTGLLGYDKSIPEQFTAFVGGIFVGRDYPVNDKYREDLIANGFENRIVHCSAPCLGYSQ
ncbi:MAG: ABC transporter permease, partial [Leifsonia sp.]